ncbi:hypothetical protein [Amycolatopsis aidingensis]|uniref:hypothetical protein n=1 Tax=Amycolatopsis aidingensis TaxID=2842453 RepID=UPI001C0B7E50|nr:hypothetical protein [Amycolatopsis aidingensis]
MPRLLLLAVLALGTVLVAPGSAQATKFPETYLADSQSHGYCFVGGGWFQSRKNSVHYAMDKLGDPTDMTTFMERGGAYPGDCKPGTDVAFFAADLPGNVRGLAQCADWNSSDRCNKSKVTMDYPQLDEGPWDWQDRRKTALHEIGHTVGLGHHSPGAHDCAMLRGPIPNKNLKWRQLHPHDHYHINRQY